ncbi:YsnF/AvaK domain-containing protein [Deinococcus sp.]|uniref:YsnF/AvaK domain-containing protein n=1 Tax=Deinococcus sp. TaxID=47478 RepID=UPI003CC5AF82
MDELQPQGARLSAAQDTDAHPVVSTVGAASSQAETVIPVARLELREERAQITADRYVERRLSFSREVRTRTETHSAELRSEVLVIRLATGGPAVLIGDHELKAGESYELPLYDERLEIIKQPYLSEVVEIGKRAVIREQSVSVELNYEVLTVADGPALAETTGAGLGDPAGEDSRSK